MGALFDRRYFARRLLWVRDDSYGYIIIRLRLLCVHYYHTDITMGRLLSHGDYYGTLLSHGDYDRYISITRRL